MLAATQKALRHERLVFRLCISRGYIRIRPPCERSVCNNAVTARGTCIRRRQRWLRRQVMGKSDRLTPQFIAERDFRNMWCGPDVLLRGRITARDRGRISRRAPASPTACLAAHVRVKEYRAERPERGLEYQSVSSLAARAIVHDRLRCALQASRNAHRRRRQFTRRAAVTQGFGRRPDSPVYSADSRSSHTHTSGRRGFASGQAAEYVITSGAFARTAHSVARRRAEFIDDSPL